MRESSIVVRPEPMESATYTASTRLKASGLARGIAAFEAAAGTVPLPDPPNPITVADYGAANGYNSLLPIGAAIRVLRGRTRPDHAILVAHTDLPDNDFTALFTTLTEDPDSYLLKDGASFASAVGRSFYQQILPSDSIVLGWSSWATQWLSRVPAPVGDHIHIAHSTDESARRAYAAQAATDWNDFLAFRGRELAPGGRLVVLTLSVDSAGGSGFGGVMEALQAGLSHLVEAGVLRPEELHQMVVPTAGRSEKDLRAPFSPSGRFEGLAVDQVDDFEAEDRFWARYRADGDAGAFGAGWAAFARSAIFPTLLSALQDSTDESRLSGFADRLEAEVAAWLARDPQPVAIPLATVVMVKHQR
jgi:hypothetical protein